MRFYGDANIAFFRKLRSVFHKRLAAVLHLPTALCERTLCYSLHHSIYPRYSVAYFLICVKRFLRFFIWNIFYIVEVGGNLAALAARGNDHALCAWGTQGEKGIISYHRELLPPLEPLQPLGYAKDASARLQSVHTKECLFNGTAELLKRLGGAYRKLQQAEHSRLILTFSRTAKRLHACTQSLSARRAFLGARRRRTQSLYGTNVTARE